jgi:hypothetical protein
MTEKIDGEFIEAVLNLTHHDSLAAFCRELIQWFEKERRIAAPFGHRPKAPKNIAEYLTTLGIELWFSTDCSYVRLTCAGYETTLAVNSSPEQVRERMHHLLASKFNTPMEVT